MMRYKRYVIIGLLMALAASNMAARANAIEVNAYIDSVALFIGEQATLSIEARQPRDEQLQFPVFSDNITGKLELVETLAPDTVELSEDVLLVTNRYKVTAFDSAVIYMPGFPVTYGTDTLFTNALILKILDMPVDTTQQAIADIKNVHKPPFDWIRLLTIIAISILAAGLTAGIIILAIRLRKNKNGTAVQPQADTRPAYETALAELYELQNKKLWQNGLNKEYQSALTDIIKQYISRQFSVNAVEQSTEDLLATFHTDAKLCGMKNEIKLLASILKLADLVKFAKMLPLPADNERSMKEALQFVELTRPHENAGQQTDNENKATDATMSGRDQ
ncbi:MAG: hypothetical protein ACI3Z7_01755 [Candidatus Aphodosoma sp.]